MSHSRQQPRSHRASPDPSEDDFDWSDVPETRVVLEKMRLLCHSQKELKRVGYVLEPLTPEMVETRLRCRRCGGTFTPDTLSRLTYLQLEQDVEHVHLERKLQTPPPQRMSIMLMTPKNTTPKKVVLNLTTNVPTTPAKW